MTIRTTATHKLLVLLAILGLVAAACGSDDVADVAETVTGAASEAVEEITQDEPEAMEEEAMAANPYEGETLEMLVPFSAGGGSDTWTRLIAPFYEKYLDATVVVINDGGKTAAVSSYENATAHDGLTIVNSSGSISIPFLLEQEGVEYNYADFTALIGSPVGGVVYASTDTGITSVEDLCSHTGDLFMGAKSFAGLDAVPVLALDLLGVPVKAIDGLEGAGPIRAEFEAGTYNLSYDTSGAKGAADSLAADGLATLLFTFGITQPDGSLAADPAWPDLPTTADAYETCTGSAPGGEAWDAFLAINTAGFAAQKNMWIHADAPADRVEALKAASVKVANDPEFQALAKDVIGDYEFVTGDALNEQFAAASAISPEARSFVCDFLSTNYGIGGICGA